MEGRGASERRLHLQTFSRSCLPEKKCFRRFLRRRRRSERSLEGRKYAFPAAVHIYELRSPVISGVEEVGAFCVPANSEHTEPANTDLAILPKTSWRSSCTRQPSRLPASKLSPLVQSFLSSRKGKRVCGPRAGWFRRRAKMSQSELHSETDAGSSTCLEPG